jgi:PPE-repeat protein
MTAPMDFTTLPPEITSALIHSGPGAESLVAASGAWQQLGTTLEDAAESYSTALSSLAGTWHGPSSAAMAQAVEPYVTWLRTTAQQTQQIAGSAQAAAAAFNSVQASVIPLSEVMANRTLLARLLATNGFGRNLPAIAETESEYQGMWANNSAAMSRYQASSAQASTLPQLTSPTAVTNPTALKAQSSAATAATGTSSSGSAVSGAASPAGLFPSDFDPNAGIVGLANVYANQFVSSGFPINLLSYLAQNQSAQALQGVNSQIGQGVSEGESALGAGLGGPGGAAGALGALGAGGLSAPSAPSVGGLGALGAAGLSAPAQTSAAFRVGVPMGGLTAPPGATSLQATPVNLASAASPLGEPGMPMLPPLMPPPLSPGSGWSKRKAQKYEDIAIGKELKGNVMKPPPSAG